MYGWVPSLFIWNYHDIVNQLYPNTIKSLTEKRWLQSPLRTGSLEVGQWGHLPAHSAQLEMWNYMWLLWVASHDFNLFDLGMNFLQKTWLFLFLKTPIYVNYFIILKLPSYIEEGEIAEFIIQTESLRAHYYKLHYSAQVLTFHWSLAISGALSPQPTQ